MPDTHTMTAVDLDAVARWLTTLGVDHTLPLRMHRIGQGYSNLTYRLVDADGRAWILRRPPLGHLLHSAHDVVREARIMSALAGTGVPAPRILGVAVDSDIADAPVVLMDFVGGVIVDTMATAETLLPSHRHRIATAMPATLARIHAVDLAATGLTDLASHRPYAQRQLKRWAAQWESSKTRESSALDALTARLASSIPEQRELTLVHGDYHLRNLITAPDTGAITAVLDWELSTLGDPLADMGTLLTYWPEPGEPPYGIFEASTLTGFPTRTEMARLYLTETGRDPQALHYWHALGLWKLAIIAEGVRRRALDESRNESPAGTPTPAHIDALIHKASETADTAGL